MLFGPFVLSTDIDVLLSLLDLIRFSVDKQTVRSVRYDFNLMFIVVIDKVGADVAELEMAQAVGADFGL